MYRKKTNFIRRCEAGSDGSFNPAVARNSEVLGLRASFCLYGCAEIDVKQYSLVMRLSKRWPDNEPTLADPRGTEKPLDA